MAQIKKFGTFGGVFTPSILTILGVIMYLRFPSIIGQAGLINTIGIIVIAHIISITTSLSVASLSTDKPVQNGGTYFMISRSLGLPIGGTLGLALFVGLAFSVSLYLIGFAESFLQYWEMDTSINSIRITGSIVLFLVTAITFYSTSLAIKSQYFIMAAIALSLVSIFFGNHEFKPTEINWQPLATSAPFMVLFGIFFPAVTGFEAGVSMSGDLKDPRKSLPVGAMLAVGVGFVVYIGLAVFYAYTVDANAMVNDPQILFKIAWIPALVIAGIWGATLSSALGSILGAPRILQAIAMDKIGPRVFAKGTGPTKEPRNALILAFVIAEAGILIGELDVIARIVSMFFITTYAFLNMASAIESWSSSDFRPAFKIPRFVSILGALSAFIVMILLDFLALAGATIVLGLLYFYLQRKELILEGGDAWSSFWTNLAKRSLLKLSRKKSDQRNWRPNTILFSGADGARPHLVELGLSLTGKLGALTDFNLKIAGQSGDVNTIAKDDAKSQFFRRKFECEDLVSGIKTVTSVYGFTGFEPNSILMGWSKNAKNTDSLVALLKDFKKKNLSGVFLDYDKTKGFGKKQRIDIWWNGKGRHLSFSLNILKFLLADAAWRDARLRIIVVNNDSALHDKVYRNTMAYLNEVRVSADIKIVSDDFGSRPIESIVQTESAESDLIVVGFSLKTSSLTPDYINTIHRITGAPVSTLILYPSSEFEELNLVDQQIKLKKEDLRIDQEAVAELPVIESPILNDRVVALDNKLIDISEQLIDGTFSVIIGNQIAITKQIKEYTCQTIQNLAEESRDLAKLEQIKVLARFQQGYLRYINNFFTNLHAQSIKDTAQTIAAGLGKFNASIGNLTHDLPQDILLPLVTDGKSKEFKVKFKKVAQHCINNELIIALANTLNYYETISKEILTDLRQCVFNVNDHFEQVVSGFISIDQLTEMEAGIKTDFDEIEVKLNAFVNAHVNSIRHSSRAVAITLASGLKDAESIKKAHKSAQTIEDKTAPIIEAYDANWKDGMLLINNTLSLDSKVLYEQKIIKNILRKYIERTKVIVDETVSHSLKKLLDLTKSGQLNTQTVFKPIQFKELPSLQRSFEETYDKMADMVDDLPEEFLVPEKLIANAIPLRFDELMSTEVNMRKVGNYYVHTILYDGFYRKLEDLSKILNNAIVEGKEANSMLVFKINNLKSDDTTQNEIPADFLNKLGKNISEEITKVESALLSLTVEANELVQHAYSKLFYHSVVEASKNLSAQQREVQSKRFGAGIARMINGVKNGISNMVVYVLNNTSSGILLSKKYLAEEGIQRTQNSQLLDIVDALRPDKKVYNKIPVFYRTLFKSNSKISDEFWVEKPAETAAFKAAIQRQKEGLGGAILVKGIHGSGKTTLTRYALHRFYKKANIHWVDAPVGGSASLDSFLSAVQKATGSFGSYTEIFNSLPPQSVLVINDLELWWERSATGIAVLEKIKELIDINGRKVLFVLNAQVNAYNLMNRIVKLSNSMIAEIECEALNTKQLQELIMRRHKSSGITLFYKGSNETSLSQLQYTLLFNALFNYSQGYPGVAMNIWKACIIKTDSSSITLKKPVLPVVDALENIEPDWLVMLALMIQHKHLDADKLARLTNVSSENAQNSLDQLFNAGLIVEKQKGTYVMGRNIEPHLVNTCIKKGIL